MWICWTNHLNNNRKNRKIAKKLVNILQRNSENVLLSLETYDFFFLAHLAFFFVFMVMSNLIHV